MKIYIIEDNSFCANFFKKKLLRLVGDCEISVFQKEKELQESYDNKNNVIEEKNKHLYFIDENLGMNFKGTELAKKIKKINPFSVCISISSDEIVDVVYDYFLRKPMSVEQLKKILKEEGIEIQSTKEEKKSEVSKLGKKRSSEEICFE